MRKIACAAAFVLATAAPLRAQYTSTTATGTPSVTYTQLTALGAVSNGRMRYCSNCTQANPCASGGSGAFAVRINGAWSCTGGGTLGALPAGSGSELQFRSSASAFGAVTGSTASGSNITLAGTVNKITFTTPATGSTLTLADGKTFTVNASLTLAGTDGTTHTFPSTSSSTARIDADSAFVASQTITLAQNGTTQLNVTNTNNGASARAIVKTTGDVANLQVISHPSGSTASRWGVTLGNYNELLMGAGSGLGVGTGTATPLFIGSNGIKVIDISSAQVMTWPLQAVTAGTMTVTTSATPRSVVHRFDWTNAMVAALAGTAGDIAVCTLPAKTIVKNAYVVITGAAGTVTTLTVAVGRTSASYIDYIVASDAKAAANTVYGDSSGERGTNLTGYDLPSFTGTTVVNAHFISTGGNLSTVTTSTGSVYLETETLP